VLTDCLQQIADDTAGVIGRVPQIHRVSVGAV
jgi:hypothetical protein